MTTPSSQPNTASPGGSTPFDSLPSPLEAVDDLRAAARWMIAAAGAVGAVLISGGPLVAIGKVHGLGHALIAGAALVVALAGVGLAIWQTSWVLVPPITTPATLQQRSMRELREMIDAAPADFFGVAAASVSDLLRHRAIAVNLNRAVAAEKDPQRRAVLQGHLRRAQVNVARTDPYVRWLLAIGHVWQINAALRRAQWSALVAVVLVAAGAVAFFTVTGQQGTTYVPVLTPQISATPSAPHS
jgi:hypothetical protein